MFGLSIYKIDKAKTTYYGSGGRGFESLHFHAENQRVTQYFVILFSLWGKQTTLKGNFLSAISIFYKPIYNLSQTLLDILEPYQLPRF